MERKKLAILGICGALACCLLLFDIYAFGIAIVLVGVLAMSFFIMEDSNNLPDVAAVLREDAGAVVFTNRGNATAYEVKAVLVPLDREITIPTLQVDETQEYPLEKMAGEVKVLVSFSNGKKEPFSRKYLLSSLRPGEEDLLKPAFPLFHWK